MKTKYFLGMLLGGALLTACTADDFDSVPVAQDYNQDAPVFVVSYDDPQNRAIWGGTAPSFEENDKMTLYHGIEPSNTNFDKWQRAIYTGGSEDDGAFEFKTFSMVVPGYAVMTYPANESLGNIGSANDEEGYYGLGKSAPVITVSATQNANTKVNTPYVSAILNIGTAASSDGKTAAGGYGKKYELVLRRIASTLDLNITPKNQPKDVQNAEAFKIKSIALKTASNNKVFVTEMEIKPGTNYSNRTTYKSWIAPSALTAVASKNTNELRTSDVTNTSATYTILPVEGLNDNLAALTDCEVEVETNYGKVTFAGDKEIWNLSGGSIKKTNAALKYLLDTFAHQKGGSNSKFPNEQVGARAGADITIDYSDISMTEMHVASAAELKSTLAIYDAMYAGKNLDIYLDGDRYGYFTMDEATLAETVKHMGSNSKVKFYPCREGHTCETIALVNTSASAVELPSPLNFSAKSTDTNGREVALELSGDWKFGDVTAVNTSDNSKDKRKVLNNVTSLVVLEDATLELKNEVQVKDAQNTTVNTLTLIENYGEITVSGMVYLGVNTDNYGTVTIAKQKTGLVNTNQLLLRSNTTLNNMEAFVYNSNGAEKTTGWDEGVLIDNGGTLGILNESVNSAINNYGIINMVDVDASVDITTNGDTNAAASSVFSHTNRIGSIILNDPKASQEKTVVRNNQKGFIKITVNGDDVSESAYGLVANYAIIAGNCSEVIVGTTGTGSNVKNYLPNNIKYIEVQSTKEVRLTSLSAGNNAYTPFSLRGLFVKKDAAVVIPEITTVNLSQGDNSTNNGRLFNAGYINALGKLNYTQGDGYYGTSTGTLVGGK